MRTTYLKKTVALIPAVLLLGAGIAFCTSAGLGADTHTSFMQGIGRQINQSAGTMTMVFNIIILIPYLFLKKSYIGPGSLLIGFCLRPVINLFEGILLPPFSAASLPIKIILDILGNLLIALALSLYIPMNVGLQPLDMLKKTIAKVTGMTFGNATILYSALTLLGTVIFRGDIGIGSIISLVLCGKFCDLFLPHTEKLIQHIFKETSSQA